MRPIKFNVGLPNGNPADTLATARRAEELGYYSVSIDDHFFMRGLMAEPRAPHFECFTMLSAVAAVTKSIRMLPLVASMSYRNPALLAKTMASLDNLSGGRFIAGLGAGWFREEYDAYGFLIRRTRNGSNRWATVSRCSRRCGRRTSRPFMGGTSRLTRPIAIPNPCSGLILRS
ncbi:MAG: LLM class flavin-dependent oxidoreductase [Candidatus Binatus sp.]